MDLVGGMTNFDPAKRAEVPFQVHPSIQTRNFAQRGLSTSAGATLLTRGPTTFYRVRTAGVLLAGNGLFERLVSLTSWYLAVVGEYGPRTVLLRPNIPCLLSISCPYAFSLL